MWLVAVRCGAVEHFTQSPYWTLTCASRLTSPAQHDALQPRAQSRGWRQQDFSGHHNLELDSLSPLEYISGCDIRCDHPCLLCSKYKQPSSTRRDIKAQLYALVTFATLPYRPLSSFASSPFTYSLSRLPTTIMTSLAAKLVARKLFKETSANKDGQEVRA